MESPEAARERLERETLSIAERAHVWARIEERTRRARGVGLPWPAIAIAVAVLGVAGVAALVVSTRDEAPPSLVAEARCRPREIASSLSLDPACPATTVSVRGDEWSLSPGAEVRQEEGGAHVQKGTVTFHVRHRTEAPFRVRVSHGTVKVVGTVFRIEQNDASGSVTVTEGIIEFVWDDGARERVSAGQTLVFPRPALPAPGGADAGAPRSGAGKAPPSGNKKPAADPTAKPAPDLESVMDRLLQLKSQRRFGEAATLLRQTLAGGGLGPVQRERLSYELGLALEATGQRPCSHWKNHVATFGSGRFGPALQRRIAECEK